MSVSSLLDKILVVDDDALIRDMMVDILEGYTVHTARNGREALDKLRGGDHYLVFLDLMMPVMTGEELCQHLNNELQVRAQHKIVLVSAADGLGQATTLGVDGTLRKPFAFEDAMEMVERYM
jgi:CheY-like chemotaxis protein